MQEKASHALEVGSKVEALVEGDNLYYGGMLRDIQLDGKAVVEYDDGDVATVPIEWVFPDERTIRYDGGEVAKKQLKPYSDPPANH